MSPFEIELSNITKEYANALSRSRHEDASDVLSPQDVVALQMRCVAAVERATGKASVYFKNISLPTPSNSHHWNRLAEQVGVVKALLYDIQNGYTKSMEELIHGDLFSDFLEMAGHLLDAHYKDAAAVIAGSTLEAHLRQLGTKASVSLITPNGRPKASDALNAELTGAVVYSKADQKSVTAWLGLRNSAAHGKYSEYDGPQVRLFIDGIRNFIIRNPA